MPRRKRNHRTVAISFSVVFLVLLVSTGSFVFLSGPSVRHFPQNVPPLRQPWMTWVPEAAISAGAINISALAAAGFPVQASSPFLYLYQISEKLMASNLTFLATYYLPPAGPGANSTEIEIFLPSPTVYTLLQDRLAKAAGVTAYGFGPTTVYSVSNVPFLPGPPTFVSGAISFYDGYIFYTQGTATPVTDLEHALAVGLNGEPGLFDNATVQRTLYASLQGKTDYLALYYVGFPSQIKGTEMESKTLYSSNGTYMGVFAFGFGGLSGSKAGFDAVRATYDNGLNYYILDNYVIASFSYNQTIFANELQGF